MSKICKIIIFILRLIALAIYSNEAAGTTPNPEDLDEQDQFLQQTITEIPFRPLQGKQYTDQKKIGRGTYGIVYQAKQGPRDVALKVMQKYEVDRDEKSFFVKPNKVVNEVSVLRTLNDEKPQMVPKIFEAFQDRDTVTIVMDLMKCGLFEDFRTLAFSFVHKDGQTNTNYLISREEFCRFMAASLLIGLKKLHKNNWFHADLSRKNILVDGDGRVKIIDFDAVKAIEGDPTPIRLGTLTIMPPEMFEKQPTFNKTSDYWAVGINLIRFLIPDFLFLSNIAIDDKEHEKKLQNIKNLLLADSNKVSDECIHFIMSLLKYHSKDRLSFKGPDALEAHPWFQAYKFLDKEFLPINFQDFDKEISPWKEYAEHC